MVEPYNVADERDPRVNMPVLTQQCTTGKRSCVVEPNVRIVTVLLVVLMDSLRRNRLEHSIYLQCATRLRHRKLLTYYKRPVSSAPNRGP